MINFVLVGFYKNVRVNTQTVIWSYQTTVAVRSGLINNRGSVLKAKIRGNTTLLTYKSPS